MKILKKIINISFILLLIIFLLMFLYSLISRLFGIYNTEYIFKTKKYSWILAKDNMMEPKISKNDIVVLKKCSEEDLKKEDIIYFEESNSKKLGIIKNIRIEKGKILYTTKGEQNLYYNPEDISIKEIDGKFEKTISKLSVFFIIAKSDAFSILIIIILVFLIIATSRNHIKSKERIKKRRKEKKKIM